MKTKPFHHRARTLLFIAGLTAFVLFHRNPSTHLFVKKLYDFGHVPLFGLVSLALLRLLRGSGRPGGDAAAHAAAGMLTLLLGYGVECAQTLIPGKQFETGDLFHDALGAAGFLSVSYVCTHREIPSAARRAVWITVSALMLAAFLPAAAATLDAVHAIRDFPAIASFERSSELSRWGVTDATIRSSEEHSTDGSRSLEVRLRPAESPGICTQNLLRDWSRYDLLRLDLYLPGDHPLSLTVRIEDEAHNQRYEDRYNGPFTLHPGPNRLEIPLIEIAGAPQGRKMDLSSVSSLCLFSYQLRRDQTLFVDNIRLCRGSGQGEARVLPLQTGVKEESS